MKLLYNISCRCRRWCALDLIPTLSTSTPRTATTTLNGQRGDEGLIIGAESKMNNQTFSSSYLYQE